MQIVECVHVAADMKQVTLHCASSRTNACVHERGLVCALQVCRGKNPHILRSSRSVCMLSHLGASPLHSLRHTQIHTLPALSAAAAAVAMVTPVYYRATHVSPKYRENPNMMWVGAA